MPIQAQHLPRDRPYLERLLRSHLLTQRQEFEQFSGDFEKLHDLEVSIRAIAKQLEPDAPEAAILTARRGLAYSDLADHLVRRADLPADPTYAPKPVRIRTEHLERKILDLARNLDPGNARRAIIRAKPIADEHLARQMHSMHNNPTRHLQTARRQLDRVSLRLRALASPPEPPLHTRVVQAAMALGHLDHLHDQTRILARSRKDLLCRGNAHQLVACLEALPDPRAQLDPFLERVFRHPERARRRLAASYQQPGEHTTLMRLADDPAAFGRLRGRRIPLLGNTRSRTEALETAAKQAKAAAKIHNQHGDLSHALDIVITLREQQDQNRELIQAFPDRESLMADLGRYMEPLEPDHLRLVVGPKEPKFVQEVRRAEQHYLEPLQDASSRLARLDPGQVRLSPQLRETTALFREAPRHILRRLTQPQKNVLLMATSMVRSMAKICNPGLETTSRSD